MSGRPLDVLKASFNELVTILLKGGSAYFNIPAGYDQHMNVVLEEILGEDIVSGNIELEQVQDTIIMRGDNVVTIKA